MEGVFFFSPSFAWGWVCGKVYVCQDFLLSLSSVGQVPLLRSPSVQPHHPNLTLPQPETMLTYMDYVQNAFFGATSWNCDNSYTNITATARGNYLSSYFLPHFPQNLIRPNSPARLPHPSRVKNEYILPIHSQIRHFLRPRQPRHSRRQRILPLLLSSAHERHEECRGRFARRHDGVSAGFRAETSG